MAKFAHFSFLGMIIAVALATDDPQQVDQIGCSDKETYTYVNATAFQENRDSVLASLLSGLSAGGYATKYEDSAGKTDPVYGIAVCRNYLSASECSECFMKAANLMKENCPRSSGGRIHLDGCFLRYENSSTFNRKPVDTGASRYCYSTNDSDPQAFSQKVQLLSTQLIPNASANNSYAVGNIDGTLYGLAQCWPSLTSSSCQVCLIAAQIQLLSCLPQREGRGLEAGCFMRYSPYSFFSDNQNSSPTNQTPSSRKSSSKIVSILLGSLGGTTLIAVLCLVLCRRFGHFGSNARTAESEVATRDDSEDENVAARGNFEQSVFEYEVLRDSTGNFDRNNMLGKGGFGEVFKGRLPDGTEVAVKKLTERQTTQAAEEFLREVKLLTSVRHRNLVRLLGCCTRGHQRLLVYEFMSNNSLHRHLFGEIRNCLSWDNRLNIIVGIARGLAYLHEDSNVRIIHRDIKCGNILLDDRLHPKIADFGLARLFPEDETHVSTRVRGTIGYTAPEYAVHGKLTEKADVYSYGIVVLEIVSRRKCADERLPESVRVLLQWAWNEYEQGMVLDIVDPTLEGDYPIDQVSRVITIALLCTQGYWALRPSMSQVMSMLTNNFDIRVQPTKPAFIDAATAGSNSATLGSAASPQCHTPQSRGSMTASLFPR